MASPPETMVNSPETMGKDTLVASLEIQRALTHASGSGVLQLIGQTPLIHLTGYLPDVGVDLFLKLECANPGGSAKDRPALRMIQRAIHEGRLGPGSVVIETSSGNMGIGLAQVCRYYGLRFICVVDRKALPAALGAMRALGAEIEIVDVPSGRDQDRLGTRLARVATLVDSIEGAFWPNQYANQDNPRAHARGTMAEIDSALGGDVDAVFVGVGTTGTLGGCLDFVATHRRSTRIYPVDLKGSVLFGGTPGERHIPGMGAGTVPPLATQWPVTEVLKVTDLECVIGCRRLAQTDALLVGGSAGGVLHAIRNEVSRLGPGRYVAIAADSGHRYLDTVFNDAWVQQTLGCSPGRLADLVGDTKVTRL